MAERWFLKIDSIEGDSTDVDHENEIEVRSWTWGVQQSDRSNGGGGGAGKATFDEFSFVSRISKASPALFLACASGSQIESATLTGLRGAGKGRNAEFLKVTMEDVLISSFSPDDLEDDEALQSVSLTYGKFEMEFRPSSTGAPQPSVTAGWDIKLNKKI